MSRSRGFTWEPLPPDVFSYINGFVAVVQWDDKHWSVICRDPDSGIVTKRQPTGLDSQFRMRGIFVRWLRDPRARTLRLPWVRGRYVLSEKEWNQ